MTKKDLLVLLFKFLALGLMIQNFIDLFGSPFYFLVTEWNIQGLIFSGSITFVIIAISILFIYYAEKIITFFKLDDGFNDDIIDFSNITIAQLTKLGIFIIACIFIAKELPTFLTQSYWEIQAVSSDYENPAHNKASWIVSGFSVLIGILMISYYQAISQYFINKEENKNNVN